MRVALVGGGEAIAAALPGAERIPLAPIGPVESVLALRGFTPGLTTLRPLRGFDVVHAFTALHAAAALRTGVPVVFTCTEVLDRSNVADRRLRLWALQRATEDTAAVLAADDAVRASMQRWLALSPDVLAPEDHERLYRSL